MSASGRKRSAAFETNSLVLALRHAIRERRGPQTVYHCYTHQFPMLSSTFAKLLIPKNSTFRSITVTFPCLSVAYCFKSELIIPWVADSITADPPSSFQFHAQR